MNLSLRRVVECVKKHKRFLITSHKGLEGDALGSELAFAGLLRRLGKTAAIVNEDAILYGYDFLPGIERIKTFSASASEIGFDCFVALDCSGLSRCGKVARLAGDKPTLNIDHHISNCRFADVNWVDSGASSACEMTYSLYKAMRQPINKEAALSLYTGIFTDTGSFRYPNTSAFTHRAAADLLRYKLDVARVYKKTYEDIPFACVGVLNKVLATVKRDASGRIAWLYLEKRLYQNLAAGFDLTDYILGIARAIKGIEVAALFRESLERPGYVRVNLRSQGKVDVNRIASSFGGGGHRTASGCTVKGSLVSVSNAVIREICRFLK